MMRFHNDPGVYVAHLILRNNSLRLGSLLATNDPYETMMWVFSIGSSWSVQKPLSSAEVTNWAERNPDYNRIIRHGCKVLCVSEDAKNAGKLDSHERAYGKPRMWAQYGGNHTGVCLLFDKQALNNVLQKHFQGSQSVMSGSIEYGDVHESCHPAWLDYMEAFHISGDKLAASGLENVLRSHRDKHMQMFFFRKNRDWESESEYRWIVRGKTNDPEFIPVDDALRAILLGANFAPARLAEVHEYCKRTDTCLSRINWWNGKPFVYWFEPNQLSAPKYRDVLQRAGLLPLE